jgi:alpha-L-rhamnosidase
LFRDRPDGNTYSQQANVMAVLTDTVAPADQSALMERVLSDATLT